MTKYPFPVEFIPNTPQIYHGPKTRMYNCLQAFNILGRSRITESEFLDFIVDKYGDMASNIEKVKFYKYFHKGEFCYFAVFWTGNDALFRDVLYDDGKSITELTGWYPLVTGSRISRRQQAADVYIREKLRYCMNRTKFESTFDVGIPMSLEKISLGQGNSFLIKTSVWNLLLDVGIDTKKLDLRRLDKTKKTILILSHAHTDHVGGIKDFIQDRNVFIISTELTLDFVLNKLDNWYGLKQILPKNFFYRVFPARYGCVYKFDKGGSLAFFYSSHYPGGAMVLLRFKNNKSFLYTGDFSLSSEYGVEAKSELMNRNSSLWKEAQNCVDWALIDAALSHESFESPAHDNEGVFERIHQTIENHGCVLFLIEPQDLGFFLCIDLLLKERKIPIYVDPFIKRLLNSIDKYFKLRRTDSLWPALQPFLAQRNNLFESVWLYEMDQNWVNNVVYHHSKGYPYILILDYKRALKDGYGNMVKFQTLVTNSNLTYIIGKRADSELTKQILARSIAVPWGCIKLGENTLFVRDDYWLSHCSYSELERLFETIGLRIGRTFLFHQYPESIDAIAKSLGKRFGINICAISKEKVRL